MPKWRLIITCRISSPFSSACKSITDLSKRIHSMCCRSHFISPRAQQTRCSTSSFRFTASMKRSKSMSSGNRIARAKTWWIPVRAVWIRAQTRRVVSLHRKEKVRWLLKHSITARSREISCQHRKNATVAAWQSKIFQKHRMQTCRCRKSSLFRHSTREIETRLSRIGTSNKYPTRLETIVGGLASSLVKMVTLSSLSSRHAYLR